MHRILKGIRVKSPLIAAVAMLALSLFSEQTQAFAIPQPSKEIAASKLAYIQLNAANGEVEAQYLLGLMYLSGRFVVEDKVAGLAWLTKAAEGGEIKAQQTLADLAFEGKLMQRDLVLAERWYLPLAEQGNHWARFRLGFLYASGGEGVDRHCGKAVAFFSSAGDDISLGNAAWILATCPEAKYRDGGRALALAKQLLEDNNQDPTNLDNLAAAYAELGDFSAAVATQQQAITALELSQDLGKVLEFRQRLESYRSHKPYREVVPLME